MKINFITFKFEMQIAQNSNSFSVIRVGIRNQLNQADFFAHIWPTFGIVTTGLRVRAMAIQKENDQ